jgi:signal transduction histidine kinase
VQHFQPGSRPQRTPGCLKVSLMTPAIQTLFSRLQDGVGIISAEGTVRYANAALLGALPVRIGTPFPHEPVRQALEQVLNGHLSVPHSMQVQLHHHGEDPGARYFTVHLVASPVPTEIIVVMVDESASVHYRTTASNLFTLIERLLLTPASSLAKNLHRLLADASILPTQPAAVQAQLTGAVTEGQTFCRQLATLTRLAQQSAHHPLHAQDRIKLADWLPEVVARHQPQAHAKGQHIELETLTAPCQFVSIYGSAHWLGIAMSICIDNAITHSAPNVDLVISCQHTYAFVRIVASNQGRLHQQRSTPRLSARASRRSEAATGRNAFSEIDLPLARALVELHSGHLTLRQDLDGFIAFTVELPTGANAHADKMLDIAQSQRFANDLARLIRSRNARSTSRTEPA